MMILEGAPYQTDIPPGTVLYTSGLGGLYPPGIPVGTVRSVSAVESGWEKSYRVEPAVRPEQVDVALVWRRPVAR
jgi:rod shape-determining protein MreC